MYISYTYVGAFANAYRFHIDFDLNKDEKMSIFIYVDISVHTSCMCTHTKKEI